MLQRLIRQDVIIDVIFTEDKQQMIFQQTKTSDFFVMILQVIKHCVGYYKLLLLIFTEDIVLIDL